MFEQQDPLSQICRKFRGATYSAVDYFSPYDIRKVRNEMKLRDVFFTCLATRAVHIEVAASMSADFFLNSYHKFICKRGPVRTTFR